MYSMSLINAAFRQVIVVLSACPEVWQVDFSAPLSSMMPNLSGYPGRPLRSENTVLAVVRLKLWLGSRDPYQSTRLMSQPSAIMNEPCALTVAAEFSL